MRSRRLRRGFTLIELVVVIALMAVIVGVSAPALASLDHRATDCASAAESNQRHRSGNRCPPDD
jgi:prepilin-type N-terminal cleavage/methylation domain-containing protein